MKEQRSYSAISFLKQIDEVVSIDFEISPGRGNPKYTGDKSAFDIFIVYRSGTRKGFIGIEVKYAETLLDKPAKYRERYAEVARSSGHFTENGISHLSSMPVSLEQVWRDHLLALSMQPAINTDFDEGLFVYLFPAGNTSCTDALKAYSKNLQYYTGNDDDWKDCLLASGLQVVEMEQLLEQINKVENHPAWTKTFFDRYLDFGKIDRYSKQS